MKKTNNMLKSKKLVKDSMKKFICSIILILVSLISQAEIYNYSPYHIDKANELLYNLEKVPSYFKDNPQNFTPVGQYVMFNLTTTKNKDDYNRFKALAEKMGLKVIPPYSPPKKWCKGSC